MRSRNQSVRLVLSRAKCDRWSLSDIPVKKYRKSLSFFPSFVVSYSNRNCQALQSNDSNTAMGPIDRYHWRVCVEDTPAPGEHMNTSCPISFPRYAWWDVQSDEAALPIMEKTPRELTELFLPSSHTVGSQSQSSVAVSAAKAAKGALHSIGKALHHQHRHTHRHHHGGDVHVNAVQHVPFICSI